MFRILAREILLLSQSLCGAKCLQDSLPHLPRELQQNLVHTYSDLTSYNQDVEHNSADHLFSVNGLPASARLCQVEGHPSLTQLVDHVYYADQEVLCLLN